MKEILCIGNSFSSDATAYLEDIALSNCEEFRVWNLYIGGCSLETHVSNLKSDKKPYELIVRDHFVQNISLKEALSSRQFDIVTVQQSSPLSGIEESYEPYINILINEIKSLLPNATIYFHRTWAYDADSTHPEFYRYDNNQDKMYNMIICTTNKIVRKYNLKLIKAGDFIQLFRDSELFKYNRELFPITRDGFHLSFEYGRYIAGVVWYLTLSEKGNAFIDFYPKNSQKDVIDRINGALINIFDKD